MDFESTRGFKSPLRKKNIIRTKPSKLSIRLGKNTEFFKRVPEKVKFE